MQTDFLKNTAYFSSLSAAEIESLGKLVFEKAADRGEIVLFEGEPAAALYFVVSGVVKVFKTSADGKEQTLDLVRPGESFNDVPIFDGAANLASAEAMGAVLLYGIRKSDMEVILRDYPAVALNLARVLSKTVERMVLLIEDLSFKHVTGRVARILLENIGDGAGEALPRRLTQQEMAAMAGTAREIVGRSLKSLEEDGIVRLDRHRVVIVDKAALKEMAGITP